MFRSPFSSPGRLQDAVGAATEALAAVGRVSTWPWRPETLRGFVSAVVLPVALWLLFQVLGLAFRNVTL